MKNLLRALAVSLILLAAPASQGAGWLPLVKAGGGGGANGWNQLHIGAGGCEIYMMLPVI